MTDLLYTSFRDVPYPCYFLGRSGEFWSNTAAREDNAPDKEHIRGMLAALAREYAKAPGATPPPVPLLDEALRLQGLTALPVKEGLLAFITRPQDAPIEAFSAELRDPLSDILMTLPIIANKLEDEDQYLAETMQRKCYQLLRLSSNLENVARTQRSQYAPETVDLAALVDSLCTTVANRRQRFPEPLSWEVPETVVPVLCEADLVSEALLNLLRNSMQYTRDGNEIHVRLAVTAGRAVLTVEDRGLGIRGENLEHIFEPYFSAEPYGDSRTRPGLGLGLPLVRETARRFGGTVAAESRFGEGTRISLSLPLSTETGETLDSDPADYLTDRYSPVYVQLHGLCLLPAVNKL